MNALKQLRNDIKKYIDTADDKVVKMIHAMLTVDADPNRWDEMPDDVQADVEEATTRDHEMVKTVIDLIEKEYKKHHTYKELAKLVYTNTSKLQFTFKLFTNKSLYEYLTIVRVKKAKSLLKKSDLTVEAVANEVGLDRTNLNIQFKKITGKSPSTWRMEQHSKIKLFSFRRSPASVVSSDRQQY